MDAKMKEFLIKVSQDEELKKELTEKLGDEATEATEALKKVAATVARFAQDKGFDIDYQKVLFNTIKIDDEALEEIAGGRVFIEHETGELTSDCECYWGGGGVADEYQNTCACVIGGGGSKTDLGSEEATFLGEPDFIPLMCSIYGCDTNAMRG